MRRLFLVSVLFLAGCGGNVIGPFQHRPPERVDDPMLTIGEQQRLGRERLALPDESSRVAPHSGAALPGTFGR
jgi:hypothetical protein